MYYFVCLYNCSTYCFVCLYHCSTCYLVCLYNCSTCYFVCLYNCSTCYFVCLYNCSAQDVYTSSPDPLASESLSRYQSEISSVTSSLSNISQEFSKLSELLKGRGNIQASDIIGEIQSKENEKLQLVKTILIIIIITVFS